MWRTPKRLAATAGAAALLAGGAVWLIQAGLASPSRSAAAPISLDRASLGRVFFAPRFARPELVLVVQGVPRSVRIDHGRAVEVVAGSLLRLREADGTVVDVPVAPGASVRVRGRPAPVGAIRRGFLVLTAREGDGPAFAVEAYPRRR